MPITSFLHSRSFDPETVKAMSQAFENACRSLSLADRDDPLNELIATQVIKLAESGVRSSTGLYMLAMKEFKANPQ